MRAGRTYTGRVCAAPHCYLPSCQASYVLAATSDGQAGSAFAPFQLADDDLDRRHGALVRAARAVEVGVVQKDHVAVIELAGRPGRDPRGSREPPPVLAPARPQQRL